MASLQYLPPGSKISKRPGNTQAIDAIASSPDVIIIKKAIGIPRTEMSYTKKIKSTRPDSPRSSSNTIISDKRSLSFTDPLSIMPSSPDHHQHHHSTTPKKSTTTATTTRKKTSSSSSAGGGRPHSSSNVSSSSSSSNASTTTQQQQSRHSHHNHHHHSPSDSQPLLSSRHDNNNNSHVQFQQQHYGTTTTTNTTASTNPHNSNNPSSNTSATATTTTTTTSASPMLFTTSSGDRLLREIFTLRLSRLSTKITLGLMLKTLLLLVLLTVLGICISLLLYLVLYPYHNYYQSRLVVDVNQRIHVNSVVSGVNGVLRQGLGTFETTSVHIRSLSSDDSHSHSSHSHSDSSDQVDVEVVGEEVLMHEYDDEHHPYLMMKSSNKHKNNDKNDDKNMTSSFLVQIPFVNRGGSDNDTMSHNRSNAHDNDNNNNKRNYPSSFMVYSTRDGCIRVEVLSRSNSHSSSSNHMLHVHSPKYCDDDDGDDDSHMVRIQSVQTLNYRQVSRDDNDTTAIISYQSQMAILYTSSSQSSSRSSSHLSFKLNLLTVHVENDHIFFDGNATTILTRTIDNDDIDSRNYENEDEREMIKCKMSSIAPFRVMVLCKELMMMTMVVKPHRKAQVNLHHRHRRSRMAKDSNNLNLDWFTYHVSNGTWTNNGTIALSKSGQQFDVNIDDNGDVDNHSDNSIDMAIVSDSTVLVIADAQLYAIEYHQQHRIIDSKIVQCPSFEGTDIFKFNSMYNYQLKTDCDGSFVIHCRSNFIPGHMNSGNQIVLASDHWSLTSLVDIERNIDPRSVLLLSNTNDIGCLASNCSQPTFAINYRTEDQMVFTSMCAIYQLDQIFCSSPYKHTYHSGDNRINQPIITSTMVAQKPTYYQTCWNEFLLVSILSSPGAEEVSLLIEEIIWHGGLSIVGMSLQGTLAQNTDSSVVVGHKGILQLSQSLGSHIITGQTIYAKPDGTLTSSKTSKVVGLVMSRTKILLDDSLVSVSSKNTRDSP